MTETIRHVLQRMILADLELLHCHLGSGVVLVEDPSQQKMIQAELLELIERRKETISKRRINSEGEKSNKVEREPKIGAEVKPEGPEVKPEGP